MANKKKEEIQEEPKEPEYGFEAKRLAGLLNDYFNGHYRIDAPDLRDILNLLEKL